MHKLPYYLLITVALISFSPLSAADDIATASIEKAIDASFSELERQLIGKYFDEQGKERKKEETDNKTKTKKSKGKKGKKGLPPGLAKRGELPPGLAKREQLPPGLAKRALPGDLQKQLPPPPEGYERQIVEDAAIVLIHKATGKIVDIIKDVVIGQ